MSRAVCRSCGAPIEWAYFLVSGKATPLDPGRHLTGNLEVVARDGDLYVRVVPAAERAGRALARSHFATCPNAASHRRP